jgi:hypothetical protein
LKLTVNHSYGIVNAAAHCAAEMAPPQGGAFVR